MSSWVNKLRQKLSNSPSNEPLSSSPKLQRRTSGVSIGERLAGHHDIFSNSPVRLSSSELFKNDPKLESFRSLWYQVKQIIQDSRVSTFSHINMAHTAGDYQPRMTNTVDPTENYCAQVDEVSAFSQLLEKMICLLIDEERELKETSSLGQIMEYCLFNDIFSLLTGKGFENSKIYMLIKKIGFDFKSNLGFKSVMLSVFTLLSVEKVIASSIVVSYEFDEEENLINIRESCSPAASVFSSKTVVTLDSWRSYFFGSS